jgi:hypothetical protein
MVKDPAVISAAYNDASGVTAEFNRNVLAVINRELGADFDRANFDHVARYDSDREWIEMRLRAQSDCTVHIQALDLDVSFAAGEEMRTEISARFTPERLADDLRARPHTGGPLQRRRRALLARPRQAVHAGLSRRSSSQARAGEHGVESRRACPATSTWIGCFCEQPSSPACHAGETGDPPHVGRIRW